MFSMRLRFPELLEERGVTPYALARDSKGRISLSTVYRLKKARGRIETFAADMLEAMCDVLKVSPGDLFERDDNGAPPGERPSTRAKSARKTLTRSTVRASRRAA